MLTLMTALALVVAQGEGRPVEIFAKEGFYKETKGAEQEFVGILKKTPQKDGVIGFGRVNPFRLEMEGNKVREVYAGSQGKVLDPYVGKKVKLVGKAVDMEVEGRQHHEIWTATLTVLGGEKDKKVKGKAGEVKIIARTPARVVAGPAVVKSADQLAELKKSDPAVVTADLAKMMKVPGVDWTKQMLIVISGGGQPTGGYSVDVKSLEVKDGKLIVHWKLNSPAPGSIVTQAFTNPSLSILVDRFEGDVVFEPKSPPDGGIRKKLGS